MSSSDSVDKAEEFGREAVDKAREASQDAWEALRLIFTDPMGGQKTALEKLGQQKAFGAGIVFSIVFVLASYLVTTSTYQFWVDQFVRQSSGFFNNRPTPAYSLGFADHVKILFTSLVPLLSLGLGFLVLSAIFKNEQKPSTSVFQAGVVTLPLSVSFLLCWLVGAGNYELVVVFSFYGVCISLLLVNASLTDIQELTTRKAVVVTPTFLLAAGYLTKVILMSFLGP